MNPRVHKIRSSELIRTHPHEIRSPRPLCEAPRLSSSTAAVLPPGRPLLPLRPLLLTPNVGDKSGSAKWEGDLPGCFTCLCRVSNRTCDYCDGRTTRLHVPFHTRRDVCDDGPQFTMMFFSPERQSIHTLYKAPKATFGMKSQLLRLLSSLCSLITRKSYPGQYCGTESSSSRINWPHKRVVNPRLPLRIQTSQVVQDGWLSLVGALYRKDLHGRRSDATDVFAEPELRLSVSRRTDDAANSG